MRDGPKQDSRSSNTKKNQLLCVIRILKTPVLPEALLWRQSLHVLSPIVLPSPCIRANQVMHFYNVLMQRPHEMFLRVTKYLSVCLAIVWFFVTNHCAFELFIVESDASQHAPCHQTDNGSSHQHNTPCSLAEISLLGPKEVLCKAESTRAIYFSPIQSNQIIVSPSQYTSIAETLLATHRFRLDRGSAILALTRAPNAPPSMFS